MKTQKVLFGTVMICCSALACGGGDCAQVWAVIELYGSGHRERVGQLE